MGKTTGRSFCETRRELIAFAGQVIGWDRVAPATRSGRMKVYVTNLRSTRYFRATRSLRAGRPRSQRITRVVQLFPKRIAAEEILTQIGDGIVKCLAGIARTEVEFARRLGAVEIPEVLRHLNRTRFNW